nr:hypothetical protein [Tanacetum cinerariifolium]
EDPADYPTDHDDDDEEQDKGNDDEEEEHPASADSIPPPPALCVTARISFRPQPLKLSFTKEDAKRFFAMPIPPPSPLTPLSSLLPQIPSPPLPASPPILSIPLPTASPPLQLLSSDRRADRTKVTLPLQKRLSIVHCLGYEAGESSAATATRPIEDRRADYGFVDSVEAEIRRQRAEDIGYGATPSTTTTTVTNAQLQAMIDQDVNAALAARDANQTGDDSHTSGTGVKRTERELALLCVQTCPEESDRIERYIGGLPDSIHGSVAVSKPKTMQEATEMATGLMDKKIRTYAERQAANKRKFEDTSRKNQGRQQPPKRQDVARAYAAGSSNRQQYAGSRPLFPKCNFNHDGPCIPRCYKCNKIGHLARDCRSLTNANVANNQKGNGAGQKVTCIPRSLTVHVFQDANVSKGTVQN